jgi:hypothetical protein
VRDQRPDLILTRALDPRRWPLDRLSGIPSGWGADLKALGVFKKPVRPGG